MSNSGEFSFIDCYLTPLTAGHEAARGLQDDAAVISVPAGMSLVMSKDMLQEGVHFVGDESPRLIAQKLLRANLSDLAAMGATPYGYALGLGLPPYAAHTAWMEEFTAGLAHDQRAYDIFLLGGDTTRALAHLSLSITIFGLVPEGKAIPRSGARAGDRLYVSGTLGDGALGLKVKQGMYDTLSQPAQQALLDRYLLPQPRLSLGYTLQGVAHAAMDISDGLLQDAGHIARASGVGMRIYRSLLPLSPAAQEALQYDAKNTWQAIVAGGDDYELLVCLPANLSPPAGLTYIGEVIAGSGVVLLDEHGQDCTPAYKGYQHF